MRILWTARFILFICLAFVWGNVRAQDAFEFAETNDEIVPLATDDPERELPTSQNSLWARFPVGSWARIRTTSVVEENGRETQSSIETKIVLKSANVKTGRYVLQYESRIKMGDVDYQRRTERVQYDLLDVPCDDKSVVEELPPENIVVANKAIPCRKRRVTRESGDLRETTTVWYSKAFEPCVMQKETTRETADNGKGRASVARELSVAQNAAAKGLGDAAPQYYIVASTARRDRRAQRTTTTLSLDVPGGLARQTTIETSTTEGETTCRTTKELLDYYIAQE